MMCAWEPLQAVLPQALQHCIRGESINDLQELRLRLGQKPELNYGGYAHYTDHTVTREEITHIINAASRYSPWCAETIAQGYLTISGGHRIGLCGQVIYTGDGIRGIRAPDSLCIRIARDIRGIGAAYGSVKGSVLIIGAPGWGKTTLLRDIAREISKVRTTVVVDERGELFPDGFLRGRRMDVLRLCPKAEGMEMALRTMGPEVIAVDEISAARDCEQLIHAANCGVSLLATAHAASLQELHRREVYRPLLEKHVFQTVLVLQKDKSCRAERMEA